MIAIDYGFKAFPMYVGMNRQKKKKKNVIGCVPHVRGDEPTVAFCAQNVVMRSPCTWG